MFLSYNLKIRNNTPVEGIQINMNIDVNNSDHNVPPSFLRAKKWFPKPLNCLIKLLINSKLSD